MEDSWSIIAWSFGCILAFVLVVLWVDQHDVPFVRHTPFLWNQVSYLGKETMPTAWLEQFHVWIVWPFVKMPVRWTPVVSVPLSSQWNFLGHQCLRTTQLKHQLKQRCKSKHCESLFFHIFCALFIAHNSRSAVIHTFWYDVGVYPTAKLKNIATQLPALWLMLEVFLPFTTALVFLWWYNLYPL